MVWTVRFTVSFTRSRVRTREAENLFFKRVDHLHILPAMNGSAVFTRRKGIAQNGEFIIYNVNLCTIAIYRLHVRRSEIYARWTRLLWSGGRAKRRLSNAWRGVRGVWRERLARSAQGAGAEREARCVRGARAGRVLFTKLISKLITILHGTIYTLFTQVTYRQRNIWQTQVSSY